MKKFLVLMPLLFAAASFAQATDSLPSPAAPAFKAHVLSRPEVDELLKKPENLLFIDVRRPDEVTNVGGFPVYLSVQIDSLTTSLNWVPKDRVIVTVSNHAARAGKAADILTAGISCRRCRRCGDLRKGRRQAHQDRASAAGCQRL